MPTKEFYCSGGETAIIDYTVVLAGIYPNIVFRYTLTFSLFCSTEKIYPATRRIAFYVNDAKFAKSMYTKVPAGVKTAILSDRTLDIPWTAGGNTGCSLSSSVSFKHLDRPETEVYSAGSSSITDTLYIPVPSSFGASNPSNITSFSASVSYNISSNDLFYWRLQLYDRHTGAKWGCNPDTSSGSTVLSGLSPFTSYNITALLIDRLGNTYSSGGGSTAFTTSKPNAPSTGKVQIVSIGMYALSCSLSGWGFGSGATYGYFQWSLDGTNWNNIGNSSTFTVSGLSPDTVYAIYARLVDNYGTPSTNAIASATTSKPVAPSKGSVAVSGVTPFEAFFTWEGFGFGSGASWGKYQYSFDASTWLDCGQETSIRLYDLLPERAYIFYVRLVDNYGTVSANAMVSFVTLTDQARMLVKHLGTWCKGKSFYKKSTSWIKIKKIYKKKEGAWHVCVNSQK